MNPQMVQGAARPAVARLSSLAVAACLAACTSLSTPVATESPTDVPAQWSAGSARTDVTATDLSDWWQRFDDPALAAVISTALEANTSVKGARAALRQARALADIQQAGRGPSVSASGSALRRQSGGNDAGNTFEASLDASYKPDVYGGIRASADAADSDAQAREAGLSDVRVSLAAQVASAYITLRGLQTRLALARANLAIQLEALAITRWRAQAGLVSTLDVEQAVSVTEETRAQVPALQTGIAQALHALAVLTGQPPGALNDTLGPEAPIPPAPADLALAFPADTLRQRPDVRAAEHDVQAAWLRVAVADAARYPGFSLSGSLGLSSLALGSLLESASMLKWILASVSLPVFDGGAAKARVRAQQAALEQAREQYESTVLTALQEVEDALVAIRGDRERLSRLQAAASAATNAERLARQRYASGLIDFSTVLTTQRSLLSIQDSLASTQASLSIDHVSLYKALGGGWTPQAPGSAVSAAATAPGDITPRR